MDGDCGIDTLSNPHRSGLFDEGNPPNKLSLDTMMADMSKVYEEVLKPTVLHSHISLLTDTTVDAIKIQILVVVVHYLPFNLTSYCTIPDMVQMSETSRYF